MAASECDSIGRPRASGAYAKRSFEDAAAWMTASRALRVESSTKLEARRLRVGVSVSDVSVAVRSLQNRDVRQPLTTGIAAERALLRGPHEIRRLVRDGSTARLFVRCCR